MKKAVLPCVFLATASILAAEPQRVIRHSSLVTGEGGETAVLAWNLPPYATLEGDILTVDVPGSAAREGCRVSADIDLSPYDGVPFEAEIEAQGERIGKPRDAWNGLKFQFEYSDPDSGERFHPNTQPRLGDFPRQKLLMRDALCTPKRDARLVLGLQDTSGKVVFDLSTLRIREGRPFWPVTNQTHRCAYSAPVGVTSDERRLTSEVDPSLSPSLVTRHSSLVTAQRSQPLRGVMSPSRDMTEDDFRTLHDWGATLLRYQMIRQWHAKNANRDLPEFDAWLGGRLDHFESVVLPMCRQYGLRVVLDLHVTPGGRNMLSEFNMFFEREYADHFIEIWRRMATRFRGNADVIYGYDLCNEPVQYRMALPDCDWWSLQRRATEAIRVIDPETPIIIESNLWDVPSTFGTLSPLTLTNVIYEVHVYNPVEFTHQGVGNRSKDVYEYPNPARGWDKEKLRGVLSPVRAFEKAHGAKIYVGEFSAIAWAPGADQYIRDCIDLFAEFGWDWTYHAFREWEGWSVEHEALRPADSSPGNFRPSGENPRRRALLDGLAMSCALFGTALAAAATMPSGRDVRDAPCELRLGAPTGAAIKPLNGVGGGPKSGWGLGRDGGILVDASGFYRDIAPPFVRLHDIEPPFGRGQCFDMHVYLDDATPGHARYFARSDAYIDSILAAAPGAKVVFRLGESIGATDSLNPYAVKPGDTNAWCAAAVDIARHYARKYPEVEWFFEIWNEPNLTGDGCHKTFASAPDAGDTCPAADYFDLYEAAATALGTLREEGGFRNMRIGGPAASGIDKGNWSTFSCEEFIGELERRSVARGRTIPLDFYSWHRYDGPESLRADADRVGAVLARSPFYRGALNICDEWNLSVDPSRLPAVTAPEGAANQLATMIALQSSALDAAAYYDAQLSGGFNGLWHKPPLDITAMPPDVQIRLLAEFRKTGVTGVTEAVRRLLAEHDDLPLVPLCGYWAMRAWAALSSLGMELGIQRGESVPATLRALGACNGSAAAVAVVNVSAEGVSVRIVGEKRGGPVTVTRVSGEQRPHAHAKAEIEVRDTFEGALALDLPPFGIALVEFGRVFDVAPLPSKPCARSVTEAWSVRGQPAHVFALDALEAKESTR